MEQAISVTVTGVDQGVGFRALVMKQAICYNLSGSAKNEPNFVVRVVLQGDADRIKTVMATVHDGTARSANLKFMETPAAADGSLKTFTVYDWTSTTRHITNPYTLVFQLRADGSVLSHADAKAVWHQILRSTLKGDDLAKLGPDD